MQRGDLVVVAMQGDHGKPRPALVIQSDLFDELPTVTVLPLVSSQLVPAITRVDIAASDTNGLRVASQIVVHRPQTISRAKVSRVIGRADDETMLTVIRALAVFVGLACDSLCQRPVLAECCAVSVPVSRTLRAAFAGRLRRSLTPVRPRR